jgi:hypothetical protein
VYGFGAKLGSGQMDEDDYSTIEVSHCFPINSDWVNPHYSSVDEIIKAYRTLVHPVPGRFTLPDSEIYDILGGDGKKDYVKRFAIPIRENIKFSSPTVFMPLLDEIEYRVRTSTAQLEQQQLEENENFFDQDDSSRQRQQHPPRRPSLAAINTPSMCKLYIYHILVIITDGQVADFESVTQKVKQLSEELPLCVVIIGVGAANFQLMKNIESANDSVKFVEFRRYSALNPDQSKQRGRSASTAAAFGYDENGADVRTSVISTGSAESGVLLARDVLADIPSQFLRYVRKNDDINRSRRGSQGTSSWTGDHSIEEGFERMLTEHHTLDERLPTYEEAIEQH